MSFYKIRPRAGTASQWTAANPILAEREIGFEFPAGGIERRDRRPYGGRGKEISEPEDALSAAKRELLEETGYISDEWTHLLTVPSDATVSDNYAYLFTAENCRKVSGQALDETEVLKTVKHTAWEIDELIRNGGFQQAMHITAWLLARKAADKTN